MSQYKDKFSIMYLDEEDHVAEWIDSDDDEEYDDESDEDKMSIGNLVDDIAAMHVKKHGRDIQGIPFEEAIGGPRDIIRQRRLQEYVDIEDVPNSGKIQKRNAHQQKKAKSTTSFSIHTRSMNVDIPHFQLRNLVWAETKHDVYLMGHFSVLHWSALTFERREIIDLLGHVKPSEEHYGNLEEGYFKPDVCSMAIKDNLLLAGGMKGEIICKFLDCDGISYCCNPTPNNDESCTYSLEIFENPSGSMHFLATSNDYHVRDFDVENFKICNILSFPWFVNHTSMSPDGKLAIIVGDNIDGLVVNAISGQTLHNLRGHLDYSFASAWNPDNLTFATGNQDRTCRIWDIRNLSKSIAVLCGNMGAIRSIRYTSDGKFMAMAETTDFLHIFDVGSGYKREQEVDLIGEIAGISFSPDTEALFVGMSDVRYNSLIEFRRQQSFSYLDTTL
ncbi:hypothetical protein QOZ80_8AG0635890 [Eleusine coracana subsp. coracana]|nr:hypothetical protein QOZ80_8AG0635890 [Eleusine coracana subsp. coracana]